MHCDIYKFPKHSGLYVYIARRDCVDKGLAASRPDCPAPKSKAEATADDQDGLDVLPPALRQSLGEAKFVIHLDLACTDKLAQVDIDEVTATLTTQGYFVQSPPADMLAARAQANMKAAQDKKYD